MADKLTPSQRSRCMSRIRGRDTKPEILVRKGLHAHGFRFRLQDRKLPGRPDIVLPKYGVASTPSSMKSAKPATSSCTPPFRPRSVAAP